jgi:hypothetical protein
MQGCKFLQLHIYCLLDFQKDLGVMSAAEDS